MAGSSQTSSARSPRLLIGGNVYGAGNIGDDAVLVGIVAALRQTFPGAMISAGSYDGAAIAGIAGVDRWVNGRQIAEMSDAIAEHDGLIIGGGTMIGDELGETYPVKFNAMLAASTAVRGRPVMMFGVGANRLRNANVIASARLLLSLCSAVTTRDRASYDVCIELGATPSTTALAGDPAFVVQPAGTERLDAAIASLKMGPTERFFGVNVVNESWTHCSEYKQAIAQACDILSERYGYTPVFFCNEIREGDFGDRAANIHTAAMMRRPSKMLPNIYLSPQEMAGFLQRCEFVIAMRMHALIFSAIAGIPFASIARIDKVDNFMHECGLRASGSVDHCHAENIVDDIVTRMADRDGFARRMGDTIAGIRQRDKASSAMAAQTFAEPRRIRVLTPRTLAMAWLASTTRERLCRLLRGEISPQSVARKLHGIFSSRREA